MDDEERSFEEEKLLEALEGLQRSDELMRKNRQLFRELLAEREQPPPGQRGFQLLYEKSFVIPAITSDKARRG